MTTDEKKPDGAAGGGSEEVDRPANCCGLCPASCTEGTGPGYKRFVVAWLTCLGLLIVLAMRCELGIAIIKMTEKRHMVVMTTHNKTTHMRTYREVPWGHTKVGLIEAAFFIGYMAFNLPGGFLATVFPTNIVMAISIIFTCVLNLFIPLLVHTTNSFIPVFITRVLQGMFEGCLYPCVHSLWRYWAPQKERSKLVSISFFGMALGPVVGYPLNGYLTSHFTWPVTFYFWASLGIAWSVVWLVFVGNSPASDRWIGKTEAEYIEKHASQQQVKIKKIPWMKMFLSIHVWAIVVANVGRNWTFQFSFSGLPNYYKMVFDEHSTDIGVHMAIPYILMALLTPIGGHLADVLIRRGYAVITVRRLFNSLGYGIAGLCFIIVGYMPVIWAATLVMSVAFGSTGIGMSGFGVNHLDISAKYSGILMGLSNGLGTLSGIISPIAALRIVKKGLLSEWRIFFLICGVIHIATVVFFGIFTSGSEQPWSLDEKEQENKKDDQSTKSK